MKQLIQLVVVATVFAVTVFTATSAQAQKNAITLALVKQSDSGVALRYEVMDAPKLMGACASKDNMEFIPFNLYFTEIGNDKSATFNRLLSEAILYCKNRADLPNFHLVTYKK